MKTASTKKKQKRLLAQSFLLSCELMMVFFQNYFFEFRLKYANNLNKVFCNLFLDLNGVLTYLCIDRLGGGYKNVQSNEMLLEKIKICDNDTI